MATSALAAAVYPTLDSTGLSLGVVGATGGAPAGMTVAVAGSGNGKTFHNNGGETRLLVANTHATLAKTITPIVTPTPGGVTITSPTRSIAAGNVRVFRFDRDYEDADGYVTVEAESTDIYYLAIL